MWKTQWSAPQRFTLQRLTLKALNIGSITEKPFQIYAIARRSIMRWYFSNLPKYTSNLLFVLVCPFRALTSFQIQCLPKFSWNSQCFCYLSLVVYSLPARLNIHALTLSKRFLHHTEFTIFRSFFMIYFVIFNLFFS